MEYCNGGDLADYLSGYHLRFHRFDGIYIELLLLIGYFSYFSSQGNAK